MTDNCGAPGGLCWKGHPSQRELHKQKTLGRSAVPVAEAEEVGRG